MHPISQVARFAVPLFMAAELAVLSAADDLDLDTCTTPDLDCEPVSLLQVSLGLSKSGNPESHALPVVGAAAASEARHNDSVATRDATPSDDAQANATFTELLLNQIEFEVSAHDRDPPPRNKLVLVLLELFILPSCCGIDRCYMGQPVLGVFKAMTFAGFGVWGFLDFWTVNLNSFKKRPDISAFGYRATFNPLHIEAAYSVTCVLLGMILCFCCCTFCASFIGAVLGFKGEAQPLPPELQSPRPPKPVSPPRARPGAQS